MGDAVDIPDSAARVLPVGAALVALLWPFLFRGAGLAELYNLRSEPAVLATRAVLGAVGAYQLAAYLLYRVSTEGDNEIRWRESVERSDGIHRGASGLTLGFFVSNMLLYRPVGLVVGQSDALLSSAAVAFVTAPVVYLVARRLLPPDDEAEPTPKLTDSNPV